MKIEKKCMTKKKKIILILLGVFIGLPLLVVIGFILFFVVIILWDKFFNVPAEPKIKHGEFPYELVYRYNGEEYTIKDSIICDYEGIKYSLDGGNFRAWNCVYDGSTQNGIYYIDKENNPLLYINVPMDARYYMGDDDATDPGMPYAGLDFVPIDENTEVESIENIDIEIIKWNPTEPIKNEFK